MVAIREKTHPVSQSIKGSGGTLFRPPNLKPFDYPPTKKPRTLHAAHPVPEVHIVVNFALIPGVLFQGANNVPIGSMSAPAPAPAHSARVEEVCGTLVPHPGSYRLHGPPNGTLLIPILVECLQSEQMPTMHEMLALMDAYSPVEDLQYSDVSSEFYHHGIEDALDISLLPVELLAMLGYLGRSSTTDLHQYIRENVLRLFGLLDTGLNAEEIEVITVSDDSVELVPKTEEEVAVVPKIEDEVAVVPKIEDDVAVVPKIKDSIEMLAEPEMSQESGTRVLYINIERVHDAVLLWREGVSGWDSGESEIQEIEEVSRNVNNIDKETDEGGDMASVHEV
jgi:hypothetical protein